MYEERGFGFYTFGESSHHRQYGRADDFGRWRTDPGDTVATALAAFAPSLAPETNQSGSAEIKASATQSPVAGHLARSRSDFQRQVPPTTNGCVAQRYVVLLTDGLPTMDSAGHSWPPLGSTAAAGYGVTATFDSPPAPAPGPNGTGGLLSTNDLAMSDVISALQALNSGPNPVKTYIIGLGAGVDQAVNPVPAQTLTAMAYAGGTVNFFPANSPARSPPTCKSSSSPILAATQATSSAAVNSTGLNATRWCTNRNSPPPTVPGLDRQSIRVSDQPQHRRDRCGPVVITDPARWPELGYRPAHRHLGSGRGQCHPIPMERRHAHWWNRRLDRARPGSRDLHAEIPAVGRTAILARLEWQGGTQWRQVPQSHAQARRHRQQRPRLHRQPPTRIQSASYLEFARTTATRPPVIYIGAERWHVARL